VDQDGAHQLRCENKLHGLALDGRIEIKCDSRFCGAGQGWTVLHEFNAVTGELVGTTRYKNPPPPEGRKAR
jgi:hypothetical protein